MARSNKRRRLVGGLLLLLLAAFLFPFVVPLNHFRRQVARALEAGLGRRVEVGTVRLKLLPVPGLIAQNVVIRDDPSFGAESLARMTELRASVRFSSFWTGRLSFSSMVFVEPSLNLTRRADGSWNMAGLLAPLQAQINRRIGRLPYLELQDGRINFKEGDRKGIFFFSDVDSALYQEGGHWNLRFRGIPSRTDRTLTGAGEVRIEGRFGPQLSSPLTLRLSLVDAYVGDLLTLASGSDHGVHGTVRLAGEIQGKSEALDLRGRLQLGDLHRWDLLPPDTPATLELEFSGRANLPARTLEFSEIRGTRGTLVASGSLRDFLEHPKWDFRLRFSDTDVRRLFAAVQHFSPRLSPALQVDGRLQGELRLLGPQTNAAGQVTVKGFVIHGERQVLLRAPAVRLEFLGTSAHLGRLVLPLEQGTRTLALDATWDWGSPASGGRDIEMTLAGRNLALRSVSALAGALGWPGLPGEGRVSLNARVEYRRGTPVQVHGWATLAGLRFSPSRLGDPVVVHTARLDFSGDKLKAGRLVAEVGNTTVTGTLYAPLRPPLLWVGELHVDESSTAALDRIFRPPGRLASALGLTTTRQSPADFLARLQAEGTLEVHRFRLRSLLLEDLQCAFSVAAGEIILRDAHATFAGGRVMGQAQLNFSRPRPEYSVRTQLSGVLLERLAPELASGSASGTLQVTAQGRTASEVNDSLRLHGRFSGRDLLLTSEALAQALNYATLKSWSADVLAQNQRVRFARLSLKPEGTELAAVGSVGFDRSLDLSFRSGGPSPSTNGSFRLVGTVAAPRRVSALETARVLAR